MEDDRSVRDRSRVAGAEHHLPSRASHTSTKLIRCGAMPPSSYGTSS